MKRLFIIGTQRSGTSSLVSQLGGLPNIDHGLVKEPNYMLFHDTSRKYFKLNGPQPRHEYNLSLSGYENSFQPLPQTELILDGSTNYLSSVTACRNIFTLYPDAYIYLQLRNPIERAISLYEFNVNRGTETRASLLSALNDEIAGKCDNLIPSLRYIHSSMYALNLAPYLDCFPSSKIMIRRFEDFAGDPLRVMREICAFCKISDDGVNSIVVEKKNARKNVSAAARTLARFSRSNNSLSNGIKQIVKKTLPNLSADDLHDLIEKIGWTPLEQDSPPYHQERLLLAECLSEDWKKAQAIVEKFKAA